LVVVGGGWSGNTERVTTTLQKLLIAIMLGL